MRLHRFFGNFDFSKKDFKIFDKNLLNQIKNVLRIKKGGAISLSDGRLNEATAKVLNFDKNFLEVEILDVRKNKSEPEIYAVLYCSVLKRENFEIVVEKATELGIKEIIPIIGRRTVKFNLKKERLEKIIKEAAEQSGRGSLPKLGEILSFDAALKHSDSNDLNIFFETSGKPFSYQSMSRKKSNQKIAIFIGPEGGWENDEIKSAKEKNFLITSLGNLVFRAETAAIIASFLVVSKK